MTSTAIPPGTGSALLLTVLFEERTMREIMNRPVLFFAVCLVAGFDIVVVARAIFG